MQEEGLEGARDGDGVGRHVAEEEVVVVRHAGMVKYRCQIGLACRLEERRLDISGFPLGACPASDGTVLSAREEELRTCSKLVELVKNHGLVLRPCNIVADLGEDGGMAILRELVGDVGDGVQ